MNRFLGGGTDGNDIICGRLGGDCLFGDRACDNRFDLQESRPKGRAGWTSAVVGFSQKTGEGDGFAMVTCDANELAASIHSKAMMAMQRPDDVDPWLRGSYDAVAALQRSYDAAAMDVRGPAFPARKV